MQTVKSLREELAKFPDDALCYAYEGEVHGVIVQSAKTFVFENGGFGRQELGVIHCQESDVEEDEPETDICTLRPVRYQCDEDMYRRTAGH